MIYVLSHSVCGTHLPCHAARIIAQILSLPEVGDRKELSGKVQRLCAGPWWDLVAIPDDVPEKKHKLYRSKLRVGPPSNNEICDLILEFRAFFNELSHHSSAPLQQ